jgi:hypothetical protein
MMRGFMCPLLGPDGINEAKDDGYRLIARHKDGTRNDLWWL